MLFIYSKNIVQIVKIVDNNINNQRINRFLRMLTKYKK